MCLMIRKCWYGEKTLPLHVDLDCDRTEITTVIHSGIFYISFKINNNLGADFERMFCKRTEDRKK